MVRGLIKKYLNFKRLLKVNKKKHFKLKNQLKTKTLVKYFQKTLLAYTINMFIHRR